MKVYRWFWALICAILALPAISVAQTNSDNQLQRLEEAIRLLESRVANLEAALREREDIPSVSADKLAWRKLQKGMSEGDVEKLLGSPTKINVSVGMTWWYYGYPSGGHIIFDGRGRTVISWNEP